jgi:hypothetical protein
MPDVQQKRPIGDDVSANPSDLLQPSGISLVGNPLLLGPVGTHTSKILACHINVTISELINNDSTQRLG